MVIEIEHIEKDDKKIVFVEVDREEAMRIIKSLTSQILENNSNVGRLESYTKNGTYFTIAVISSETRL